MVDGLAPGVEFAFRVRGVNRFGNGPWSRPVYATPKGEPTMARAPRPGFRTALTAQARGVRAVNAAGKRSPWSDTVHATPKGPPSERAAPGHIEKPDVEAEYGLVMVKWSRPSSGGRPATYDLQVARRG